MAQHSSNTPSTTVTTLVVQLLPPTTAPPTTAASTLSTTVTTLVVHSTTVTTLEVQLLPPTTARSTISSTVANPAPQLAHQTRPRAAPPATPTLARTVSISCVHHSKDCISIAALITVLDDYFKLNATPEELLNAFSHQFSCEDEPLTDFNAGTTADQDNGSDGTAGETDDDGSNGDDTSSMPANGVHPCPSCNLAPPPRDLAPSPTATPTSLDMNMSCTVDGAPFTYRQASDLCLNRTYSAINPTVIDELERAQATLPESLYCAHVQTAFAARYLGLHM